MSEPSWNRAERVERVYMVGFMGAGKTKVGRIVAERLGYRFVDLDREIETEASLPVSEIFARRGEEVFRDLEHEALRRVAAGSPRTVVATGGGTLAFPRNRTLVESSGVSVWLRPSFETLIARLEGGRPGARPLFRGRESARELYRRRLPAYRTADLVIEVAPEDTAHEVADRVVDLILRGETCAT